MIIRRNFNTLVKRQGKTQSKEEKKKKEVEKTEMIISEFVQLLSLQSTDLLLTELFIESVLLHCAQIVIEFVASFFFWNTLPTKQNELKRNCN